LNLEAQAGAFAGPASARFALVDEYLAHLGNRNYFAEDGLGLRVRLPAFCRRLVGEDIELAAAFN
jgi:hypothetical protein